MRVQVLIRMYKGKLEIYGDGQDFELDIERDGAQEKLKYSINDDRFKPVITMESGTILNIKGLPYHYIFIKDNEERWTMFNTNKNKVLKNKKKYLLAITPDSAKRGLFHNVQLGTKNKELEQ